MAYRDLQDLPRTASDKLICDKASIIAKNQKYNRYQCGLASMI